MTLECLIGRNFRALTPKNIIRELNWIINVYGEYLTAVYSYIQSLDSLLTNITQKYTHIYKICLTKIDGSSLLNYIGGVMILIIGKIEKIKKSWTEYGLRFQSFIANMKKNVCLFVMRVY